jgi:hypothetical protein
MDEGGRREEKGLLISEFGISLPHRRTAQTM